MRGVLLFAGALALISCASLSSLPYDLDSPLKKIVLPDTLNEISDITALGDNIVACVQDENGIVFIFNTESDRIERQIRFGPDGDYEGIAVVNNDLYVLRSDGLIYHIVDYRTQSPRTYTYDTGVPARNSEGLCYDKKRDRLLIGVKGKSGKGSEYKNFREIFAFNLNEKKLEQEATYRFELDEVISYAGRNGISLPMKPAKKKKPARPILKFTTSAIAIRQDSDELYLISSTDHMLMVFSADGKIKNLKMLDRKEFNKAEGLTFTAGNELLISNEAQKRSPTLLIFASE